jgi:hypothetical protein
MTYRLAVINPPEADCFSFAALSAANENNIFLCDLCGSSEAGGEYLLKSFQGSQLSRKCNLFCAPLSKSNYPNAPQAGFPLRYNKRMGY